MTSTVTSPSTASTNQPSTSSFSGSRTRPLKRDEPPRRRGRRRNGRRERSRTHLLREPRARGGPRRRRRHRRRQRRRGSGRPRRPGAAARGRGRRRRHVGGRRRGDRPDRARRIPANRRDRQLPVPATSAAITRPRRHRPLSRLSRVRLHQRPGDHGRRRADDALGDHSVPDDPFAWYRRLRENDPVHYHASAGMWFLTRYEDVQLVLQGRSFSAALGQRLRRRGTPLPLSMLNSDPPDHARLRAPAAKVFAARAVERRRDGVRAVVDAIVPRLADRDELDLLGQFARPLSSRVLAELLDVPVDERERFERLADEASANLDPLAGPDALAAALAAAEALRAAFATYLETPRSRSELGILDTLGEECARAGLARDELLTMLNLLVIGGYEPLANLVANALAALLADPDQLRVMRSDPSLIGSAVEELLRYEAPVPVAARAPREKVTIGGKDIGAAEPVVVFLAAANHDPSVFAHPERLDLRRRPNPHLAFGAGAHFCLGAPLARLVCREAILAILDRFPNLSVAGRLES